MVLPLITTVSPETEGPPQGFTFSGACQRIAPVSLSRQKSARSPSFSLSRYAEATSTRLPATATGASTCHLPSPCCQTRRGEGLGSWSSLGGTAKSGSFFLSASYLACNSFHFWSRIF